MLEEEEEEQLTIYNAIVNLAGTSDNEMVNNLNDFLTSKMKNDPIEFIGDIMTMLLDEDIPKINCFYLLVHLSNAISTRTQQIGFFVNQWERIIIRVAQNYELPEESELKEIVDNIHSRLIRLLSEEKREICQNASLCISRLFYFETKLSLWDDFFPSIFNTIQNTSNNINLIDSCFMILIYLLKFQVIHPEMPDFENIISNIYDTLKIYISNPSIDVNTRILCLKMNSKSHYMLDVFFNQEEELKGYVEFLLLNLRDIQNKYVHHLVYKLLKKTFARHIEKMLDLMEKIFQVACIDLELNDNENKAMAIDFWLGVAITEKDKNLHSIIATAAPKLVPVFLGFLISDTDADRKMSINDNDDKDLDDEILIDSEMNENSAVIDNTIICLRYFVEAEKEVVFPLVLPFINETFYSDNISYNIASLNAAYSVLKCKEFYSLLVEMMPRLLDMAIQEENMELQTCSLFIISKALKNYPKLIEDENCFDHLVTLVEHNINYAMMPISDSDNQSPEILDYIRNKNFLLLGKSFYLLKIIIRCFDGDAEMQSFLGDNYDRIWSIFQVLFDNYPYRDDLPLIRIVFYTIQIFIKNIPNKLREQITQMLKFAHENIINEIENCQINAPIFIAVNCNIVFTIGMKIKKDIYQYVPNIMETLFRLFTQFDEEIFLEALTVIEMFIFFCKNDFHIFYERLSDILTQILKDYEDYSPRLVKQTIRVVSKVFSYPSPEIKLLVEDYYNLIKPIFSSVYEKQPVQQYQEQPDNDVFLIKCNPMIPRDILPCIIEAIALLAANSSTDRIDKFVYIMAMLSYAQRISIDVSQSDDLDFAYALYEKILFCYKILIQIVDNEDLHYIKRNIKQILISFKNIDEYSIMTRKCLDLFLVILNKLVDYLKYDFCKELEKPKYMIISKIFNFIKNLPDDDFAKKVKQIDQKINKVLWLKEAYNY